MKHDIAVTFPHCQKICLSTGCYLNQINRRWTTEQMPLHMPKKVFQLSSLYKQQAVRKSGYIPPLHGNTNSS